MAVAYLKEAVLLQQKVSAVRKELETLGYKELFPLNGDYTMVHHSYFMAVNDIKPNVIDCGRDHNKFMGLVKQGVNKEDGIL